MDDFLYFITDDKGRTYAVDSNNNVVITPGQTPLQFTPDGWQEVALKYARNTTYFGMFRSFSVPLGFVKDGARIVRHLYYNYGIEAVGNLAIGKTDRDDYKQKKFFYGALNFSQLTDSKDTAEVEVTEGGLSMMIKANEDTTYEIPLDVPDAIVLRHDGLLIKASASYLIQEGDAANGPTMLGLLSIGTEGSFRGIVFNSTYNFMQAFSDSTAYVIANNEQTITYHLSFDYEVNYSSGTSNHIVSFQIGNGANLGTPFTVYSHSIDGNYLHVQFETDVTLNTGDRLYIGALGPPGVSHFNYAPGGTMKVTFDFRYKETLIKCLRPGYVFSKLIESVTDGAFTSSSTLFDGEAKDFVLTCGDAIRGISGAKLKTSLKDFFRSYNTRFNIGLGNRNEVAIIEKKEYFFSSEIIADLGEVADLQIMPAADHLFNTVKIGWPAQEYDDNDANGKSEFNTTQLYSTPVKRLAKQLDLTAAYRCDPYGIEFTRQNLEGKTTIDDKSDNDVFIINIASDGSGGYILNRPPYSVITGVEAGNTIFNVELSPKRCLLAHGNYLHSGLDKLDTGYLKFETTDKNPALSTTLDGVTITENADQLIGSLAPKLFLPIQFIHDCQVPFDMVDLIELNMYGRVKFTSEGRSFQGFIFDVGQQPAYNAPQNYKLLASPDNDMTQLII